MTSPRLHALQLSLHGTADLDSSEVLLADIRDGAHLRALFAERKPEVVFHAAALKHVNILERFPGRPSRPTCGEPSPCSRPPRPAASRSS